MTTRQLLTKRGHLYKVKAYWGEHLSECLLVDRASTYENRDGPWPPLETLDCTCDDWSPDE